MNIIEAIKSGRRFRRHGWDRWREEHDIYQFIRSDVLADDWEIETPVITLTKERFEEAASNVDKRLYKPAGYPPHISEFLTELAKELGL